MTKKTRINLERELISKSEPTIWKLISTAEGLARWIAEQVEQKDNTLTFVWGKPGQEYETRRAEILEVVKNVSFRFRWEDEEDEEAYTELTIVKLDVTNDYILSITDFAEPDDVDGMIHMWNHDVDRMHYKTGV